MNILVTGATGFIGRSLCNSLVCNGYEVVRVARKKMRSNRSVVVNEMAEFGGWRDALAGVDVVIHLAARAHILHDQAADPLEEFRRINVRATISLAEGAVEAGVKRFIFISSISVNGNVTQNIPFSESDVAQPQSLFARSKHEAEMALLEIARRTRLEVVIIRPPLVYGPNAPGNFGMLMHWVARGLPLPLGGVTQNRRSLVALDNLIDLITVCTKHPNATNKTFLVSDGDDLSTAELLCKIGCALKRSARLLHVPTNLLIFVARLLGKKAVAQNLLGSLQVDISSTCQTLGWRPPISVDEGLRRAVHGVRNDTHI